MVATSDRSRTSCAVGPSSTFPHPVGATSTPLVRAVGTGSRIERSSGRASLSNTMSSPRRGVTANPPPPNIASIRSLPSPAALTTQRQRTGPRAVASSHPRRPRADAGDLGGQQEPRARPDGLGGEGQRRGPRADDGLVRDLQRPGRPRPERGLARVELVGPRAAGWPGTGCAARSPRCRAAPPAARASRRPAARRCAPPRSPPRRRRRAAARCPASAGGSPGCPAWRRTRCARSRCSPWTSRCRRPAPRPGAPGRAGNGPASGRSRCRPRWPR